MKSFFLVFLGGGIGSILRFSVYKLMQHGHYTSIFATFSVNIIGSLLLGFLMGYALKEGQISNSLLLFLATGFCGGFTTFSTFASENFIFLKSGDYFNFAIYTLGSLILGFAAVFAGFYFSKFF